MVTNSMFFFHVISVTGRLEVNGGKVMCPMLPKLFCVLLSKADFRNLSLLSQSKPSPRIIRKNQINKYHSVLIQPH